MKTDKNDRDAGTSRYKYFNILLQIFKHFNNYYNNVNTQVKYEHNQ